MSIPGGLQCPAGNESRPSEQPPGVDSDASGPAPPPDGPVPHPSFTENRGQFGDWPARFFAHGGACSVALGEGWVAYDIHGQDPTSMGGTVVRVTFEGASGAVPEGEGPPGPVSHYLHGRDPARWVTDVPSHGSVRYADLWDGVDLEFRLEGRMLKYEFTVAPGADPSPVVMAYEGADSLGVCGETGDLLVRAGGATLRDHAPLSYQEAGGERVAVPSSYRLLEGGRVAFGLGGYDPGLPLVIDPGMLFSTFLGGAGGDTGDDVAVDNAGHVYVVGNTSSSGFPVTPGACDTSLNSTEAFVSRFSANGSSLEYSTFIGGSGDDGASGVAVDDEGAVYVVGTTDSSDLPVTSGAFCTTLSGWTDAFALKLNVTGSSLEFSTYVGGSLSDEARAMGLDANGSAYIAGWTVGSDFPEVDGSFRRTGNDTDAFLVKLKADGSGLEYSCLLGGALDDIASDLTVDGDGNAYVTGRTNSWDFPSKSGYQPDFSSRYYALHYDPLRQRPPRPDAFVTKLNAKGSSMVYSTFLGANQTDTGNGIDVDAEGHAYVVGCTNSGAFPTEPAQSYPTEWRSSRDSFVLKLGAMGGNMVYSRVLNITYDDEARAVAVDSEGCAHVTGCVMGRGNLQTTPDAFQPRNGSAVEDAFVLRLDGLGDKVVYASFLGGDGRDYGNALEVDRDGLLYVAGSTFSATGFPTTPEAYDSVSDADSSGTPVSDAFVCKLDIAVPFLVNDTSPHPATTGDPYTFNLTMGDNAGVAEAGVLYRFGTEGNWTPVDLALTWGDDRNGSWTATIDIPLHSIAPLYYQGWANDTSGLNTTLRNWSIRVADNDLPTLENLTPATGGTGNEFNLSVRVVDNVNITKVAALYWLGSLIDPSSDPWVLAEPAAGPDVGVHNFTVVLPRYSTEPLLYRFWANDSSMNWNMTEVLELRVVDDDGPLLTADPLPEEVTTGQELELRVHVRDNIGVESVRFRWWYTIIDHSGPITWPMEAMAVDSGGNGIYRATFQVPLWTVYSFVQPIGLRFQATDTSGNNGTSRTLTLVVRDDDPPYLIEDLSPGEATTGDPFNLSVRVWDNVRTEAVWVRYWFGRGRAVDLPLSGGEQGVWNATISVPHAWVGLHYVYGASDSSGNVNWSRQWDLQIVDNDPPEVVGDSSDEAVTTGGALAFEVRVEDNLFVQRVRVLYWFGDGERRELELAGVGLGSGNNGTYRASLNVSLNATGPLTYVVEATDGGGNVRTTGERTVKVLDDDRPWFGDDLSDAEAWRGEMFHLDVEVGDNVGMGELWCEWWFGEGGHLNESVPLDATIAIDVPLDPAGPLRYRFAARDADGNWNRTEVFEREVLNAPPGLTGLVVWNVTEEQDEELDLREFIEDRDDAVWTVTVESPDANVTIEVCTLRVCHDVWVPDYVVGIGLDDGRDTTWHNVTVHVVPVNDPPRLHVVTRNGSTFDHRAETAHFREGRHDVLVVHALDEDGDALTYSWQRNGVEVATGQELRYRDLPLGSYRLTLHVSDGTDESTYQFMVVVTEEAEVSPPWVWVVVLLVVVVVALAALLVRRS
jgi:hypothetical protein